MSEAEVAVIRAMNAAFNAGRDEEMLQMWDPDADFTDHIPLPDVPPSLHGADEFLPVLQRWREGFKVFRGETEEYVDLGEYVVAVTNWRFVSAGEEIETCWRGAEAWHVRGDKVVWGQTGFLNRDAALRAVAERRAAD